MLQPFCLSRNLVSSEEIARELLLIDLVIMIVFTGCVHSMNAVELIAWVVPATLLTVLTVLAQVLVVYSDLFTGADS